MKTLLLNVLLKNINVCLTFIVWCDRVNLTHICFNAEKEISKTGRTFQRASVWCKDVGSTDLNTFWSGLPEEELCRAKRERPIQRRCFITP